MTKKTRIFAAVAMSAALLLPAAVPAQAAPISEGLVVSGPISQGGSNPGVSAYGMSSAFNDWMCRAIGALCR